MKKLLTIGGSTSKNSINKQLAEYAGGLIERAETINIDLNDYEMPVFSVDIENEQGFSEGTKELNNLVENADGFIISLAEHNGAYSAAFKNAFDWLSRIEGKVWRDKPVLLLSASPGARGGQSVLDIATARFPYNGAVMVGSLPFPSFYENFKDGSVINSELNAELTALVSKLEKAL